MKKIHRISGGDSVHIVSISGDEPLKVKKISSGGGGDSHPPYDGDYEVDPLFRPQTLETKNKYMLNDVTVKAISVNYTSNPQGGVTAFIGGEFNYG